MNIKIKTSRSFYWIMSSLLLMFASDALEAQNCVAPPSGMVAWWPGDGNTNDIIGTNPAVLQGGVVFASGKIGQAFSFNGVDGMANAPFSSALNIQSAITIEAWVNPGLNGYCTLDIFLQSPE